MKPKHNINEVYHYLKKSQANNFKSILSNDDNLKAIKKILEEEVLWPLDFIEFHSQNIEYPFREITNLVYNVHDFLPPVKREVPNGYIQMSKEPYESRIQKYKDFISGKSFQYYRHNKEHPHVYIKHLKRREYDQVHPITLVDLGSEFKYEPLDGGHRITLAKLFNLDIPAWVLEYKENHGCSYAKEKLRDILYI